jgi:hypothetical protein
MALALIAHMRALINLYHSLMPFSCRSIGRSKVRLAPTDESLIAEVMARFGFVRARRQLKSLTTPSA